MTLFSIFKKDSVINGVIISFQVVWKILWAVPFHYFIEKSKFRNPSSITERFQTKFLVKGVHGMYLEWYLLLLGKPYTALILTCLRRTRYWVYHHHNLDETLRRIYRFLKEHHEVVYWITFLGSLLFYSIYLFCFLNVCWN